MNEYASITFPNGMIVQFRQRDMGCNRFKAYLLLPSSASPTGHKLLMAFAEQYAIDYDDCGGEDLATFIRFVMEQQP